jgi:hypothetical protein
MATVESSERLLSVPEVAGCSSLPVSTLDRWQPMQTGHPGLRIRRHRDLIGVDEELVPGLPSAGRGGGPG